MPVSRKINEIREKKLIAFYETSKKVNLTNVRGVSWRNITKCSEDIGTKTFENDVPNMD